MARAGARAVDLHVTQMETMAVRAVVVAGSVVASGANRAPGMHADPAPAASVSPMAVGIG